MVAFKNPANERPDEVHGKGLSSVESSDGVELAIFRAREALEAGWQLSPEEAIALVGPKAWRRNSNPVSARLNLVESEDEAEDIALYFGDR
ncbi:MAG: hypothetical protein WC378_09810 [Opitutaceae bacterium]|jgi:hypothetical protein